MRIQQKIESLGEILDRIADIPSGGRIKCGLVWAAQDILVELNEDIEAIQQKLDSNQMNCDADISEPSIIDGKSE